MRAVLHRDRVRVRVTRYDRKGRPEGRVLDILERRKAPIIGRCCWKAGSGSWHPKTGATATTS
jgi:ribonuclease R